MRIPRLSLLLIFLVLFAACDSGGGGNNAPPILGGQYLFEAPPGGSVPGAVAGRVSIAEQQDGSLTGSGNLQFLDEENNVIAAFPISRVEGAHNHPNVSMTWTIDGRGPYADTGPWSIDGTANDAGTRITGTLTREDDTTTQIVLESE